MQRQTYCAHVPQFHVSVSDEQGEVVAGHVGRLAGEQEHAVVGRRPELHVQLEVAVGVGQRGERDVRVAGELGRRYEFVCREYIEL